MHTPPWWLAWVGYGLQGVVAALARNHARKSTFHWPMAHYTLWVAVVDFARHFLEITRPHHRSLFTIDELSFLSEPVALLWTTIWITDRCPSKVVPRAAIIGATAITIFYPRSAAYWVYAVVQALCVGGGWYFFGRAFWRGKCWLGVTEMTLGAYLAAYTTIILGDYFPNWRYAWSCLLGLNILVIAIHLGWEATIRMKPPKDYD